MEREGDETVLRGGEIGNKNLTVGPLTLARRRHFKKNADAGISPETI